MPLRKATDPKDPQGLITDGESKAANPAVFSSHAPKADKPMTRTDWDSKDQRISRQGLFQAALQSPALMQYAPTLDAYIELVVRTANAGLAFVND